MTVMKKTELQLEHKFDSTSSRHYLNGACSVLHCHHFATLYCQLADDAEIVDGKKLLYDSAEETFYPLLSAYYEKHGVCDLADRLAVAEEYFSAMGMGALKVTSLGDLSATAELSSSHVDEGWIKKWDKREEPVNFITQGYVAAVLAAALGAPAGSFLVEETESIVSGAEKSLFRAVRR